MLRPQDDQYTAGVLLLLHSSAFQLPGGELNDAIQQGTAIIAESEGRIKAYASSIAFVGHAVGESNRDLKALISAAEEFQGPGILVPNRNPALFHWCLENRLRVVQPMTLMTTDFTTNPLARTCLPFCFDGAFTQIHRGLYGGL